MKSLVGLITLGLLVPWAVRAQDVQNIQTLSCQDALTADQQGNDNQLTAYATQLWESWDNQAMANGQPTNSADDMPGEVQNALRMCNGNPNQQFEDALRPWFQMGQNLQHIGQ